MVEKELRSVFVIMPFTRTPKRNKEQLTAFFEDHLKPAIESGRFKCKYTVTRSDDTFNITEKIIKDVYHASIVLCDLSGKDSNPNVMYELGMRLALTHDPVILIRETNEDNRTIFDISGFFAHPYDPLNYPPLLEHIKSKIRKLESGEEEYKSPVLTILQQDNPLLAKLSIWRAREKLLFLKVGIHSTLRLFCGYLASYIKEKDKDIDMGESIEHVIAKINEQKEAFEKVDFSGFHCALSTQPMINDYLAEQFLNNITPADIVGPFTMHLLSYHTYYFSMDILHSRWSPWTIYSFVGETWILLSMIDVVRASIGRKVEELVIEIERMKQLKEESHHR